MNQNTDLLKSGGYAGKQIFANCNILRWSHLSRFEKGVELVKKFKPQNILDYGCGDATFLIFLRDLVSEKFGLEVDTNQLDLLKMRFKDENGFTFMHVNDDFAKQFEMVTCFEVLEHCNDDNVEKVLDKLNLLCSRDGTIVISVPKETGLTMVGKQTIRRILGMRKYGGYEYSERYSFADFFKMLFATENTKINRQFHEVSYRGETFLTCGHKGFNWKYLKKIIESKFDLKDVQFTPKILPMGLVSSQVWFICKKRQSSLAE